MSDGTGTAALARPPDDAVFARLYGRYYRSVRDFCRRRVACDLVDDAVAETFLVAWRHIDDVPTGGEALVWLYGVAYRVIGHQLRSTARRRRLETRLGSMARRPVAAADEEVLADDECRRVLDAAARLGETDSEVLRLDAWEQLGVSDIADVLGIAPNAAKQRLHRARQHLAREYRLLQSRPTSSPDATKGDGR